jgi:hypothetical protein
MPTSRCVADAARLAGRHPRRRRDRRNVATSARGRDDRELAPLSCAERDAVEAEASRRPLPGVASEIAARWVS